MSALGEAIEKLDRVFSLYVRRRDCRDDNGYCISCGISITVQTSDAGHYIDRQHLSTRWYLSNVNAQCRKCNRQKRGNKKGYQRGLIRKYGPAIIDNLEARKRLQVNPSIKDIEKLTEFFNEHLKRL